MVYTWGLKTEISIAVNRKGLPQRPLTESDMGKKSQAQNQELWYLILSLHLPHHQTPQRLPDIIDSKNKHHRQYLHFAL